MRIISRSVIRTVLVALVAFAGGANAQMQPPPTESAVAKPVRVVCMAETVDALVDGMSLADLLKMVKSFLGRDVANLDDAIKEISVILNEQFPPVGGWRYAPLGSGFVVDAERNYVITNWHVARGCMHGRKTQIGIIEATDREIVPILADVQTERLKKLADGRTETEDIPLKALCRNRSPKCSAWSNNDDIEFFAPDLAILKLRHPAKTMPIPLTAAALTPGAIMELPGFPQVAMNLSQAAGGSRLQMTMPILMPATYSGPMSRDNISPGVAERDVVRIDMLMLAAQVHSGNSGGPVLIDGKVAGVVTAAVTDEGKTQAGYALAVPVAEVVKLLDWFSIKPIAPATDVGEEPIIEKPIDEEPQKWFAETRNQLLLAFAACLLIAGGAFVVMLRRRTEEELVPQPVLPKPETVVVPTPPVPELAPKPIPPTERVHAKVELSLSHGTLDGQRFTLPLPNGSLSVMAGRNPSTCQIVLANEDAAVSGTHACFTWDDGVNKLKVEDMRSTNGTFVNGRKLKANEPTTLMPGDTVDLGAEGKNRFSIRLL